MRELYLSQEVEEAVSSIRIALRVTQTLQDHTWSDHREFNPFIRNLNNGFERLFKVILILNTYHKEGVLPSLEEFLAKYRTHSISELYNAIQEEVLSKEYLQCNDVVQDDYMFLSKSQLFHALLSLCDYMALAKLGRYENINRALNGLDYDGDRENLLDSIYQTIMDSHDIKWMAKEMAERKRVYEINTRRLKLDPTTSTQPPMPYIEKMRNWVRMDIVILIERLVRYFSFLFTWNYLGDMGKRIANGLYDFAVLQDKQLGSTVYTDE